MMMLGRLKGFVKEPDMLAILLAIFIARMPIGMVGLSTLMFVREGYGSFAIAGTVVGVYLLAMSIGAPFQGRLIDQRGPRGVIWVTGFLQPVALLVLYWAVIEHWAPSVLFALSALAGLITAPLTVITRTLWRHRFADEERRQTAFGVDAVLIELNFTLGPASIALLQWLYPPHVAFLVAIGAIILGVILFLSSPALKYWPQPQPGASVDQPAGDWLGPLRNPLLLALFASTFALTFTFGALEVAYPAFAQGLGAPAMGGVFIALNSVGSAIGGLWYAGTRYKAPLERQMAVFLVAMAMLTALHAVTQSVPLFVLIALAMGLTIAPAFTAQSILVSRLAPERYATEAFTWSSSCIVAGIGAGMAVAGKVVEAYSVQHAFVCAGVAAALAAAVVLRLRIPAASEASGVERTN